MPKRAPALGPAGLRIMANELENVLDSYDGNQIAKLTWAIRTLREYGENGFGIYDPQDVKED